MSGRTNADRGSLSHGQPPLSSGDFSISDVTTAAGELTHDSALDAVESYLKNLNQLSSGASDTRRALIREAAIESLKTVECISAPAKLVDAFFGSSPSSSAPLQGRAVDLPDPERWPELINLAELLDELAATFGRFLALPQGADVVLALWVIHAHAHDAFNISPLLAITSPVMRCGKSRLLDLLAQLLPRPLTMSNLTAATLFRVIEKFRPTLLIDEGDTFL